MQGATRQSSVAPFPVPDVRIDARQSSERDLHWRSPTRRRHAARRRKLSGVPPAVVSGQHDGVGPPLHIKTDSRLWLLSGAPDKSHVAGNSYDVWQATKSPIAKEALDRIAAIYVIEAKSRFAPAAERVERRKETGPLLDAFFAWARRDRGQAVGEVRTGRGDPLCAQARARRSRALSPTAVSRSITTSSSAPCAPSRRPCHCAPPLQVSGNIGSWLLAAR